jgi:hypothetical protein
LVAWFLVKLTTEKQRTGSRIIKKAAATEYPLKGKPVRRPEIQDAINKFLEKLGNLLNELNNAV